MIRENFGISLRNLNTFGIEATADRLVEFDSAEELRQLERVFDGRWNVLGGGSNILFTGDYHGTLLRCTGRALELSEGGRVRVQAGMVWDDFVAWSVENGLWGAENLSHIPGTVGAAPVQNIGAYGVEAKDIIESVEVYIPEKGELRVMAAAECGFGYRDSVFKRGLRGVITAVDFRLSRAPQPRLDYGSLYEMEAEPTLANIRRAVVGIRSSKLPDPTVQGNAGSFFKNPVVPDGVAHRLCEEYPDMPIYDAGAGFAKLAAGWLIDRAGWKGRSSGRVGVHPGQALVLVNLGGATGAEVLDLAGRIRDDVRTRFGVEIEMEVNIW
jgi:UDP-N-acetylmuramate dehydrogenase